MPTTSTGATLHLQRPGAEVAQRAPVPRRRQPHLPPGRERARAAHRRITARPVSQGELSRPRARRGAERRDRLPGARSRGRRVRADDRRRARARRAGLRRRERRVHATISTGRPVRRRRGASSRAAPTTSRCSSSASTGFRMGTRASSLRQRRGLPLPPLLEPRMVLRRLPHPAAAPRQQPQPHLLAADREAADAGRAEDPVDGPARRPSLPRRFMMEEWIARRMDSPHVAQAAPAGAAAQRTSTPSWSTWTARPWRSGCSTIRSRTWRRCARIVEQIAAGLRAFHRLEMVHQDLRPENVMIDRTAP